MSRELPGVKPSNHTEAPSSKTRTRAESIDQNQLRGDDRGKWEESVLRGLDDKALDHLVRALFDNARGKADCFPKNDTLAKKTKLSGKNGDRHVRRLLNKLAARGVVALVNDPSIRSRRRVVFLSHPNAEAVLAALPPGANVRLKPDKMSASMSASRGAPMSGQGGHPDPPNPKGNPEEETLKTTTPGSAKASSRADASACEGDPAADPIAAGAGGRFVADDSSGDGDDWAAKFMAYVGRVVAEVKRLGERIELDDLGLFGGHVQWQPGETPEAMAGRLVAKYAELANWRPENTDDLYVVGVSWGPGDTPETMAGRVVAKFIEAEAGMIAGDDDPDDPPPANSEADEAATAAEKAPESPQEAPKAAESPIPSSEARESPVGDPRPSKERTAPASATDHSQAVEAEVVEEVDPAAKVEADRRRREEAERQRKAAMEEAKARIEREEAERRERNRQQTIDNYRKVLDDPNAKDWLRKTAENFLRLHGLLDAAAVEATTPAPVEVGAGGIDDDIDF